VPDVDVEVNDGLVRQLLAEQFAPVDPAAARARLTFLAKGWDNALFRLGESLIVRLPLRELAAPLVANEARWLPELAPRLPVAVPAPVFVGAPGAGYPWTWTVVPWIDGDLVAHLEPTARGGLVEDLAATLLALHQPAPPDAPSNPFRSVPLAERRNAIEARWPTVGEHVGAAAVKRLRAAWADGLDSPPWREPRVWVHGDAHPLNLLHRDGALSGVIDFGDITSGDPANDLATAWWTFTANDRERFLRVVMESGKYDEAAPARAAAWAVSFVTAIICDPPSRKPFGEVIAHTIKQFDAA
jgi:aminoglycoside phosphotransferase (APT) family kinase protein